MTDIAKKYMDSLREQIGYLNEGLVSGRIDATSWHNAIASELFSHHLAAYADGAGIDVADAIPAAKKIVGGQVEYLSKFTDDVENGRYEDNDAALRARAEMYAGALRGSFYSGRYPSLTQVPGDGNTRCLTNCGCALEEQDDGVHWILNEALENCEDCQSMAAGSPYGRA